MLCVTGKETTLDALQNRLQATVGAVPQGAELAEVRLDALEAPGADLVDLLQRYAGSLLVCCRPVRQGGWFRGPEADRLDLLHRAAKAGCAYIDVEVDVEEEALGKIWADCIGRVLSWHGGEGEPVEAEKRIQEMLSRGADIAKLAVPVADAVELEPLLQAGGRNLGRVVVIGMGFAGLLSRCRYRDFGSAWTYVSQDADGSTAEGQLTLGQAREMGLPESAFTPFLALIGGPQIAASPGPRVYNRLFRKRGLSWSYVPVLTQRPKEALRLLHELGAIGLSVTMPHKTEMLDVARPDPSASAVGAINSIRFYDSAPVGTNTDIDGIAKPLRKAVDSIDRPVRRGLILGAGGAARAAALACRRLQIDPVVSARNPEKASALLERDIKVVSWPQRETVDAELLINATPVCGAQSPWPDGARLNKAIVFDLAMSAEPSRLLELAAGEGALALGPEKMWIAQGASQIRSITGADVNEAELEELMR